MLINTKAVNWNQKTLQAPVLSHCFIHNKRYKSNVTIELHIESNENKIHFVLSGVNQKGWKEIIEM